MSNRITYTATTPAGDTERITSVKPYTHAIYVRDVVTYGESADWRMARTTTRESLAIKQATTYRNAIGYENVVIVPLIAN